MPVPAPSAPASAADSPPHTRATRRANRRNTRLLAQNPLLEHEILHGSLQDWLTTPAAEKAKLEAIDNRSASMFAGLARLARKHARRAATLRAVVARYSTPDQLTTFDARRLAYPADPVYAVGYWFEKLKQFAPAEAHRRCANKAMHDGFRAWYDRCPCCGQPLEQWVRAEQLGMEF